jgi:predicted ArsR family transcriptional regulator
MVGPLTDEEIAARLPGLYEPTVRTARSRLSKRGLVVPTGETRRSARGREMHVWQVVQ